FDTGILHRNALNNSPKRFKDLSNTYQQAEPVSIKKTLYQRFKEILSNSIGEVNNLRELYGIYRSQTAKYLKFEIHKNKTDLFESLAIEALNITTQATRKKKINNLNGFYYGVLNKLIGNALFDDAYKYYDAPVNLQKQPINL